ncbi:MAG: SGNH/GDSL hydrolase family protein [Caldimonas sp.]
MTLKLMVGCRGRVVAAVLASALVATACGGGDQESKFKARRVLAFGDESSLIVDSAGTGNGSKYSINGVVSAVAPVDATIDCRRNALWIQRVATLFNLVFPQCNPGPTPVAAPASRIRATFGATTATLSAQIDAQQAESAIGDGDLATVLVGENDILALYASFPASSESALIVRAEAAGAEVGRQVNRLASTGAKVIISTIPDVGVTPFARTERLSHSDTDRAALLTRLSGRFNASLRATIDNDGRRIGLVLLDELVSAVGKFNGLNGFSNSSVGACDLSRSMQVPASILDCTDLTLITGAGSNSFLWADDRHLSAGGQSSLGNLAATRVQNNPF